MAGFDPGKSVLHSLDEFAPPQRLFPRHLLDGEPVGCGGFTPLGDDASYLKRMWIRSEARGHGLGRRFLASPRGQSARSIGYRFARLETDKALPEAQQLYRSSGYIEVAAVQRRALRAYWFEKRLDAVSARAVQTPRLLEQCGMDVRSSPGASDRGPRACSGSLRIGKWLTSSSKWPPKLPFLFVRLCGIASLRDKFPEHAIGYARSDIRSRISSKVKSLPD